MTLHFILNAGSGAGGAATIDALIAERFGDVPHELHRPSSGAELPALAKRVARSAEADDVVIAVGGDGTVNAVAAAMRGSRAAMGVVPLGTFNYFARGLDIPLDPAGALDVVKTGVPRVVGVGLVNDTVFLNNASLGLYTALIREREADKKRFGRRRIVAMFSAARVLLRGRRPFRLNLTLDGAPGSIATPLVFVGHNQVQLKELGFGDVAKDTPGNSELAVVALKPVTRWQMLGLVVRAFFGKLARAEELGTVGVKSLELSGNRRRVHVVVDGEILTMTMPLHFAVDDTALRVVAPAVVSAGVGTLEAA